MAKLKGLLVSEYAKMWSREIFDLKSGRKLVFRREKDLLQPGVYILYRDDHPYYIGKTSGHLFERVWAHANQPKDRYYHFWNFFSAFVIPEKRLRDEVEGLLIAAMPTANNSNPRIRKIPLPLEIARLLRRMRQSRFEA